jgi:hypothetical protein
VRASLALRERGVDRWLGTYVRETPKRRRAMRHARAAAGETHLLLCVADHYEPQWGRAGPEQACARVQRWADDYPRLLGGFRDSDGRPPRHSFFFPIDEYDEQHVDAVADLCRAGYGELEIHLHHDHDTADALRERLLKFKELFAHRHGMLARHRRTGDLTYGFIHGNWALDNSRPDGCWCGVNNELDVLRETGCYADFTLPSFPSRTQTRKINSIYYVKDDPRRPKSHDWGVDVGTGGQSDGRLMLVQGPLMLDWGRRKWGVMPRVEIGNLQHNQPPRLSRVDLWLRAGVRVPARPDWAFVKLHTHGAPERNADVLLGPAAVAFHEGLARRAQDDPGFHYHYVTAREMYNLARAAESGWDGGVDGARDFELSWNGHTPPAEGSAAHAEPGGAAVAAADADQAGATARIAAPAGRNARPGAVFQTTAIVKK